MFLISKSCIARRTWCWWRASKERWRRRRKVLEFLDAHNSSKPTLLLAFFYSIVLLLLFQFNIRIYFRQRNYITCARARDISVSVQCNNKKIMLKQYNIQMLSISSSSNIFYHLFRGNERDIYAKRRRATKKCKLLSIQIIISEEANKKKKSIITMVSIIHYIATTKTKQKKMQ